jgi:hypothetical protein
MARERPPRWADRANRRSVCQALSGRTLNGLIGLTAALAAGSTLALGQSDIALPRLLPPGASLRGTYALAGAGAGPIATALSFPLALPRAPSVVVVPGPYCTVSNLCPAMPPPPSCPGSIANPQAAPGVLCVYEGSTRQNLTGPPQLADPATGAPGGASAVGAVLTATPADVAKPAYDSGTWAVTAPLPARVRIPLLAGLDPRLAVARLCRLGLRPSALTRSAVGRSLTITSPIVRSTAPGPATVVARNSIVVLHLVPNPRARRSVAVTIRTAC